MNSQGKRKAPNGMYWCNIMITNKGKCVMVEMLDNGKFRAWSNSSAVKHLPDWNESKIKIGWMFKDVLEDDLTFFNY